MKRIDTMFNDATKDLTLEEAIDLYENHGIGMEVNDGRDITVVVERVI